MSEAAGAYRTPRYCPNCGSGQLHCVAVSNIVTGDGGYDAYCDECGWSGDIMPDCEQGRYREEPGLASLERREHERRRGI